MAAAKSGSTGRTNKRKFNKDEDASLTPANKKRALKAERQSHRKHATTVRSAKEIWNELRLKTNDKQTNSKLCTQLYDLLKGTCMEVAMQHDASRCVQGVLQFGNAEQRKAVVTELCSSKKNKDDKSQQNLAELCKIQYAHFVVLRMIKYCARDNTCVKMIVKSLKKQMAKLVVHSVASRVVELLFATFPTKSIAPLKFELYGPQYALFATSTPSDDTRNGNNAPTLPSLAKFIENNPDKQEATLEHLQSLLQKGLDKSLTGFSYFHSLLLDYTSIAKPNDIRSFLTPAIAAEDSLHLLSTRAGTKVVCECFAYATVKDRKKMIKCLKGYTRSSMLHRDAYLAILRMIDVMDDTVLLNKSLLAELHKNPDDDEDEEEEKNSPILDLVLSDTGHKLFLLLLVSKDEDTKGDKKSSRWQKYLDPYEVAVLHRNPSVTENGETVPTSKKEDETRRQELLVYVKDLLIEVCTKNTEEMMRSKPGSKVLHEVCEKYPCEELFRTVVDACQNQEEREDAELPLLEDPVGHLTLKHMFLSESKQELEEDDPSLARQFLSKFKDDFGDIAKSNRGAFVLSALMKTCVSDEVKAALKSHKKEISEFAAGKKGKKKLAGCSVLLEALS